MESSDEIEKKEIAELSKIIAISDAMWHTGGTLVEAREAYRKFIVYNFDKAGLPTPEMEAFHEALSDFNQAVADANAGGVSVKETGRNTEGKLNGLLPEMSFVDPDHSAAPKALNGFLRIIASKHNIPGHLAVKPYREPQHTHVNYSRTFSRHH